MRDSYHNLTVLPAIAPVIPTDNTAQTSGIIDTFGYSEVLFVINTGTLADADATFAVVLNESNDSGMSGGTAVADADTLNTQSAASFTFANDGVVRKLGYKGNKRYLQMVITPSSNASAAPMSAMCILSRANSRPVS